MTNPQILTTGTDDRRFGRSATLIKRHGAWLIQIHPVFTEGDQGLRPEVVHTTCAAKLADAVSVATLMAEHYGWKLVDPEVQGELRPRAQKNVLYGTC